MLLPCPAPLTTVQHLGTTLFHTGGCQLRTCCKLTEFVSWFFFFFFNDQRVDNIVHIDTPLWTISIWASSKQLIQPRLIGKWKGERLLTWTKVVLKELKMTNHKYAAWRREGNKVPVEQKEKEKWEEAGRDKIKSHQRVRKGSKGTESSKGVQQERERRQTTTN